MRFCYAKSLEATKAPNFHAEIVVGLESMLPILSVAKYSSLVVFLMHHFPAWLGKNSGSPVLAALFRLREVRLLPSQYAIRRLRYHVTHHIGRSVALISSFCAQ
jgi:hypothetical protein